MIEIKHLTKIYSGKGGDVTALDDVSLTLGDTGLVFILGKSGCGKSTFLNVVGGLDKATSGDVIVNGKAFSSFTDKDYDAYRNTSVGFIFQEYNVLSEFTVEDNVALALRLQGKKDVKEDIDKILEDVDLSGYGSRKPLTLSGGQKQRVAIARALVKNPDIIMADEPTGALDSLSGEQVLKTLRHLSSTRLVIVVSHDREFALEYADRIIEMKDGKVISDVSRAQSEQPFEGNIVWLGENTLSVKDPQKLTDENKEEIFSFLAGADRDVIITKGNDEVESFKKANKIKGDRAYSFSDTPPQEEMPARDNPGAAPFISSRLPMSNAIKMGVVSIKRRPIRLTFAIILCVVALTLFGLLTCFMTYNQTNVMVKTLDTYGERYITVLKYGYVSRTKYDVTKGRETVSSGSMQTGMNESDVKALDASDVAYGYEELLSFDDVSLVNKSAYYSVSLRKLVYLPDGNSLKENMYLGSYPKDPSEAAISKFTAESMLMSDVYSGEKKVELTDISDILGLTLSVSGVEFKVVGIVNPGEIPSKYSYMKTSDADSTDSKMLSRYLYDGLDMGLFVSYDYLSEYVSEKEAETPIASEYFDTLYRQASFKNSSLSVSLSTSLMDTYDMESDRSLTVYFRDEMSDLADNEIIVPLEWLQTYAEAEYEYLAIENDDDLKNEVLYNGSYDPAGGVYTPGVLQAIEGVLYGSYEAMTGQTGDGSSVVRTTYTLTDTDRQDCIDKILSYLESNAVTFDLQAYNGSGTSSYGDFSVAGFYIGSDMGFVTYGVYVSQSLYDQMTISSQFLYKEYKGMDPDSPFYSMYVPIQGDAWLKNFISTIDAQDTLEPYYKYSNQAMTAVISVSNSIELMSVVFLCAGLGFAVFSALLMFNFISVSITDKKKEIGILRAVGAKGSDVFKIFFSESSIIVLICFVLSVVLSAIFSAVLNYLLNTSWSVGVSLAVFSPLCVLMMLAIAVVVDVLGTFFPVWFASRENPADSLRAK